MSARVTLTIIEGPRKGKCLIFRDHTALVFGRADDCFEIMPQDDPTVGRHHFVLEVNPPDARLRDLGSLNGTYVNGEPCGGRSRRESPEQAMHRSFPQVDLHHGDRITLGKTTFQVDVDLPAVCAVCSRDSGLRRFFHGEEAAPVALCPTCAKSQASSLPARSPRRAPVRCRVCQKDASSEVGPMRWGDYICESCRAGFVTDTKLLSKVLRATPGPVGRTDRLGAIEEYEIQKGLGKGRLGAVYLARRKHDDRLVALKVMFPKVSVDEASASSFATRTQELPRLRHPNIIPIFDQGFAGGLFYFVLEFCRPGNVARLRDARGGKLGMQEALPIMMQSMEGLAFAHREGVHHLDLKPENILLSGREGRQSAKISDLGLANAFLKAGLGGLTATEVGIRSFPFMPREMLASPEFAGPTSDVWSMAAIFYNLLTGSYPRDEPQEKDPLATVLDPGIVPISERDPTILPGLAQWIDQALSADPRNRFQTAEEMLAQLRGLERHYVRLTIKM